MSDSASVDVTLEVNRKVYPIGKCSFNELHVQRTCKDDLIPLIGATGIVMISVDNMPSLYTVKITSVDNITGRISIEGLEL